MKTNYDKRSLVIKKSNKLIEAKYRLSPFESKLMALVISGVRIDKKCTLFRYRVADLGTFFDVEHHEIYAILEEAVTRLNTRELKIKKENGDYLIATWVASAEYLKNQGVIEIEISQKLLPYLIDIKKHFTSYPFLSVSNFKSSYSFRLYELVKQWPYEQLGFREIELTELKGFLDLSSTQYEKYSAFKRYILLTAQKEVNEKSDLTFSFQEIKEGRKITKIKFIIQTKEQNQLLIPKMLTKESNNDEEKKEELIQILINAGFTEKQILELILRIPLNQIEKNIEYTKKMHEKGKINNFIAYLYTAIMKDYASNKGKKQKEKAIEEKEFKLIEKKYREFCTQNPELKGIELKERFMVYMDENGLRLTDNDGEWKLKR